MADLEELENPYAKLSMKQLLQTPEDILEDALVFVRSLVHESVTQMIFKTAGAIPMTSGWKVHKGSLHIEYYNYGCMFVYTEHTPGMDENWIHIPFDDRFQVYVAKKFHKRDTYVKKLQSLKRTWDFANNRLQAIEFDKKESV